MTLYKGTNGSQRGVCGCFLPMNSNHHFLILLGILLFLSFPSILALEASPASDSSILLRWETPVTPPTPPTPPTRYIILRDGQLAGFTLETQYLDNLLQPETRYNYEVRAFYRYLADERGNENTNLREEVSLGMVSATTLPFLDEELFNPHTQLNYLGAFRLPGDSGNSNWHYSGSGLTFYPHGDPENADTFPGSLYGTGHNHQFPSISEISIPLPSLSRRLPELPTANTLQPFTFVGLHDPGQNPGGDVAYLPAYGNQQEDKLYWSWMTTYDQDKKKVLGWIDLNLTNSQGTWFLGDRDDEPGPLSHGKYLSAIAQDWVDQHLPGKRMITGFHAAGGGWAGLGPNLFAFEPSLNGQAPPDEYELPFTTLLEYGPFRNDDQYPKSLQGYHKADRWPGVVWAQFREKDLVIFSGTKAEGLAWYGFEDGTIYSGRRFDADPTVYQGKGDKGNTGSRTEAMLLFFNADDLAKVVQGELEVWEPQPYAALRLNDILYRSGKVNERKRIGAIAYDPANKYLYVLEYQADTSEGPYSHKSLIHVWKLSEEEAGENQDDDEENEEELEEEEESGEEESDDFPPEDKSSPIKERSRSPGTRGNHPLPPQPPSSIPPDIIPSAIILPAVPLMESGIPTPSSATSPLIHPLIPEQPVEEAGMFPWLLLLGIVVVAGMIIFLLLFV